MIRRIVFGLIILFPAIFLILNYSRELIIVDSCLDKGGSFNYLLYKCDPNSSHDFIPFRNRNPALLIAGISSVLMAMVLAFMFKEDNRGVKQNNPKT